MNKKLFQRTVETNYKPLYTNHCTAVTSCMYAENNASSASAVANILDLANTGYAAIDERISKLVRKRVFYSYLSPMTIENTVSIDF